MWPAHSEVAGGLPVPPRSADPPQLRASRCGAGRPVGREPPRIFRCEAAPGSDGVIGLPPCSLRSAEHWAEVERLAFQPQTSAEEIVVKHYVGLNVSVKETSACIVDETGKLCREEKVASHPEDLVSPVDEFAA